MSQDIINFLGEKLAVQINKPAIACKGLVRLGIKEDHGGTEELTFEKVKTTIQRGLKKRLDNIGISNSNEVCNYLLKELVSNQSLLTMANF